MLKSRVLTGLFCFCLLAPLSLTLSGCDDDVAEVETPGGEEIEVEEDGEVEVD